MISIPSFHFANSVPSVKSNGALGAAAASVPDLMASWAGIFERSRPALASAEMDLAALRRYGPNSGRTDAASTVALSRANGEPASPGWERALILTKPLATQVESLAMDVARAPRQMEVQLSLGSELVRVSTTAEAPCTKALMASSDEGPAPSGRQQVGLSAMPPLQVETVAPESVYIFQDAGLVSIWVRDSNLSDEKARLSAHESARHIAGHSGALRRLTLNGRTLVEDANLPTQGSRMLFSC